MTKKESRLVTSIKDSQENLSFKCIAFGYAYINIISSSNISLRILKNSTKDQETDRYSKIHAKAYLDLKESLQKHNISNEDYYLSLLFMDLISSAELFFVDIVKIVLKEYPKKLGKIEFSLNEIIESSSNDELILKASEQFINKLLYKKPGEYLSGLCDVLSIDENVIKPFWNNYVEAKARRDLGMHNNWKCNSVYIRKIQEAGIENSYSINDNMIPSYEKYALDVQKNILNLCGTMMQLVCEKHS